MLPSSDEIWAPLVRDVPTDALVRAVARAIRELVLPEYSASRPGDRRPHRAVEAAELWLERRSADARSHAAAVAKACTKARADTLGHEHRIAEAARALATAVTRTSEGAIRAELHESIAKIEEHLVYRLAVEGEHRRDAEVRARVLEAITRAI